jgi:hypothetical protein
MVRKVEKSRQVAELRQHARQLSRQAGALLRMADDMARSAGTPDQMGGELSPGPLAYEFEQLLAAMAERALAEHVRRRSLFAAPMFENTAWGILLMLYRNRVQGRRSVAHNLALELGCTVRMVEDQVKKLVDGGLANWCDRFNFIGISDEGASRIRHFFLEENPVPAIRNDSIPEQICA